MSKLLTVLLAVLVSGLLLPVTVFSENEVEPTTTRALEPAGKLLFVERGCSNCHTVLAEGIGVPEEGEEETEAEEAEDTTGEEKVVKMGPGDLSSIGLEYPAEWFRPYLSKETTLNEQKHILSFKGSDDDWSALVGWLTSLRAAADTTATSAAEEASGALPTEETSEKAADGKSADQTP